MEKKKMKRKETKLSSRFRGGDKATLLNTCSEKENQTLGESACDSASAERRTGWYVSRGGNSSSRPGQSISCLHLPDRCEGNNAQQKHKDKNRFKLEIRAVGTSSVKVKFWDKKTKKKNLLKVSWVSCKESLRYKIRDNIHSVIVDLFWMLHVF